MAIRKSRESHASRGPPRAPLYSTNRATAGWAKMRACRLLVAVGIANDEDGRRSWRDVEPTADPIELRSLDHAIGAAPLDGVQSHRRQPVVRVQVSLRRIRDRYLVGVEEHDEPMAGAARYGHHDQRRISFRAGVVELDPVLHLLGGGQVEERRARADVEQVQEVASSLIDLGGVGLQSRIREKRPHYEPVAVVPAPGRRQADTEIVGRVGEVDPVEPIARVVAVVVERLRSEQVVPGMEEGDALRERDDAEAQGLGADSIGHACAYWQLVLADVEKRLIVVSRGVYDVLAGTTRIAGGLAEVVNLLTGLEMAVLVHEHAVAQIAGKP